MKKSEARIVENPKFRLKSKPKAKFDGSYFRKRMREIQRSLPKGMC